MAKLSKLSRSVAGYTVLVTGAASGMGRATAHLFADEGANVAVTDLKQENVDAVVKEITDAGGSAKGWVFDVGSQEAIERIVPEIAEAFGSLDMIINNAGLASLSALESKRFEEMWELGLDVMLTGPTRIIRAAMPYLRKSDCARVVNIASTEALGASPKGVAYAAAKTGLVGVTRSLAVEFGTEGLTVNCICPGPIHTGLTTQIKDEHKAIYAHRRVPLNRYGDPEEVAHMSLNFCLPSASYITGTVIPVDGGMSIKNG